MTCIIGAKCAEGSVIVSDTRVMRGYEATNQSKIQLLWDKVVTAGSGTAVLLDKFSEAIHKSSIPNAPNFQKVVQTVEDFIEKRCGQRRYIIFAATINNILLNQLDQLEAGDLA